MSDHFTPSEEFLLEYMAPVGWRYSMAMLFWEADGNFLGQLSAIRREEQGDFTDAEMTTWRVLHPHVNAAVRRLFAMEKASAARTSLEDSVQSLPMPMTIVGWDLSVDFSNRSAREALSLWRYGSDRARALKPLATLPEDLRAACERLKEGWNAAARDHAAEQAEQRILLEHPTIGGLSAEIRLVMPQGGRSLQPSFTVQLNLPPCAHHEVGRAMAQLSRLTPAERSTVRLAAAGHENADIARELGVSLSTVRTHLRHVFEKLGITSRAKLAPLHAALEANARSERETVAP
jgi:DNA-binding CsgD family transcriptional regulator